MKKSITYIKELFDSKSYKWMKRVGFQDTVIFNDGEKDYYINFDEFMSNAYNLYFYHYNNNNERVFELTIDRGEKEFKIFGNVKNCTNEFIERNPHILFIGFSSYSQERRDLYFMFLQNLAKNGFNYYVKKIDDIEYYFLISEEIPKVLKQEYINNFVKKHKINKK